MAAAEEGIAPGGERTEQSLALQVLSEGTGTGYYFANVPTSVALGLGVFGFNLGFLGVIFAEWVDITSLGFVVPVFFSFGFVGLIIAGIVDFRAGSMFGGIWQVSYANFWLSIALLLGFFAPGVVEATGGPGFGDTFGAYLIMWGCYTLILSVGSYFIAKTAWWTFVLLAVAFFVLGIGQMFSPGEFSDDMRKAGGYVSIVDALIAWYLAAAIIWNTMSGRQMLNIFPYVKKS